MNEQKINKAFKKIPIRRENDAEDTRCLAMTEDMIVKSQTSGPRITGQQ
jgi:hypothetical protein